MQTDILCILEMVHRSWTRRMKIDILHFISLKRFCFIRNWRVHRCLPLRDMVHVQPCSEQKCSDVSFFVRHYTSLIFPHTPILTPMLLSRPALTLAARRSLLAVPATIPRLAATRTFASQSGGGGGGKGGNTLIAVALGAVAGAAGYRYYYKNDRK